MLKQIPTTEKIEFKKAFVDRYSKLTDFDEFRKYSLSYLRKCLRINTLKADVKELKRSLEKDGWTLEQVPWCEEGFWIEGERRDIGNLMEHALGKIYIQEAASMLPPVILDPKPGEIVLDMAAAPGSKTTQMAAMMENKGVIVANDVDASRLPVLKMNMQRCGVINALITNAKAELIKDIRFDKILLDAPCSGTGTIRKSLKTIEMWNPDMVKRLSITQKNLIENAFSLLKDHGEMTYSTCTLEPDEDEAVIDYFLSKHEDAELMEIKLDIKRSPAVLEFEGRKFNKEISKCLRVWPQDNDTEGFFVAKIRKA